VIYLLNISNIHNIIVRVTVSIFQLHEFVGVVSVTEV
jgi:hypothetical protein